MATSSVEFHHTSVPSRNAEGFFPNEKKPSLRLLSSRGSVIGSGEAESSEDGVEEIGEVEVDHDLPFVETLHFCEVTLI